MKENGIIYHRAFEPASRALANTTYNGEATITDADGIPLGDAEEFDVEIQLGTFAASLTSITYSLHLSTLATPTAAADLTAITGATLDVVVADASSQKVINVKLSKANKPSNDEPLYLYVKRVQVGAVAALDTVSVKLFDCKDLPKKALAGTADYSVALT